MNPLGYCELATKRAGVSVSCQQPLCVRNGRVECEEGHVQPNHPLQRELGMAAKATKAQDVPTQPDVTPYVPEGTWVVNARQTAALAERVTKLEARIAALEGATKQPEGRRQKVG